MIVTLQNEDVRSLKTFDIFCCATASFQAGGDGWMLSGTCSCNLAASKEL